MKVTLVRHHLGVYIYRDDVQIIAKIDQNAVFMNLVLRELHIDSEVLEMDEIEFWCKHSEDNYPIPGNLALLKSQWKEFQIEQKTLRLDALRKEAKALEEDLGLTTGEPKILLGREWL